MGAADTVGHMYPGGQTWHSADPSGRYCPATHAATTIDPFAAAEHTCPDGHVLQYPCPTGAHSPAATSHSVGGVATSLLDGQRWLAGHGAHVVAPAPEVVPNAHGTGATAGLAHCDPAGQTVHCWYSALFSPMPLKPGPGY